MRVTAEGAHDEVSWHLTVSAAGLTVGVGPASDERAITITTDRATAGALARSELNAQAALDTNRLRLEGNLATLAAARGALESLGDLFAVVRATTTFPVERPTR